MKVKEKGRGFGFFCFSREIERGGSKEFEFLLFGLYQFGLELGLSLSI